MGASVTYAVASRQELEQPFGHQRRSRIGEVAQALPHRLDRQAVRLARLEHVARGERRIRELGLEHEDDLVVFSRLELENVLEDPEQARVHDLGAQLLANLSHDGVPRLLAELDAPTQRAIEGRALRLVEALEQ